MTGQAIIAKLTNLESIEGADKIVQCNIFGETVIVSNTHQVGEIGVLFDCETELSHEFCYQNNLYRHSNLNKDKSKSGYIEDNRRVRPIRLKGVKCSGLWLPMESLVWAISDVNDAPGIGEQFITLQGIEICRKYVNKATKIAQGNKQGKAKENLVPTFKEHVDTDQFMRNQQVIQPGNTVIITEKLHGTSCRVGYLKTIEKNKLWTRICLSFISLFRDFKWKWKTAKHSLRYNHVVGSRRVVKQIGETETEKENSYYKEDIWSLTAEQFRGKLEKGETVYYEIVGYLPGGGSIMGSHSNSKLKKFMDKDEYKEFLKKYGDTTEFHYGCTGSDGNVYKIFVYRITLTNEEGHTVDYSWDQVKMRCEQLGVKHVPELERTIAQLWENSENDDCFVGDHWGNKFEDIISNHAENDSESFPDHIIEGVCVRVESGSLIPKFLKHKAYLFKVLEGIIKDNDAVDMEESQG